MSGRWVIGDVHGLALTLEALINKCKKEIPDANISCCGDLVDRGPRSRQTVQFIIDNDIHCVKGNHEDMMVKDVLEEKCSPYYGDWTNYQGLATLKSYEGFNAQLISHSIWMENLPLYIEYPNIKNDRGDYLVVSHSSIGEVWRHRNSSIKKEEFENFVLWEREDPKPASGIYNIYGHTPVEKPVIKSYCANIDTGAVYKRKDKFGVLTAIHFPSMTVVQQENID